MQNIIPRARNLKQTLHKSLTVPFPHFPGHQIIKQFNLISFNREHQDIPPILQHTINLNLILLETLNSFRHSLFNRLPSYPLLQVLQIKRIIIIRLFQATLLSLITPNFFFKCALFLSLFCIQTSHQST
jgi:hypothetical protein